MNIQLIICVAVFVIIAIRKAVAIRFQISHVMLNGARSMLFTGQSTPQASWNAINLAVMLFLFGVPVVKRGLEES